MAGVDGQYEVNSSSLHGAGVSTPGTGFRLVASVRRGSASNYPAASTRYSTIEEARSAATALLAEERVWNVMIVHGGIDGGFVEWCRG